MLCFVVVSVKCVFSIGRKREEIKFLVMGIGVLLIRGLGVFSAARSQTTCFKPHLVLKPYKKQLPRRNNSTMSAAVAHNVPAHLATIDLSSYDPEQSKLMEERCILVDEHDNAYGSGDKKTCE